MGQRDWIPKWPEIEDSSDVSDIEAPEHQDEENLMADFKRDYSKTTTSKHEDLLSV